MYYELYIDTFFLVNFMMDYILLSLVRRMLRCHAARGSILAGAALGALCTCMIVIIPGMNVFIKFILFHTVTTIVMIKIGLRIRWDKTFLRAYLLLYISGFLAGGVMGCLRQYLREGSLFFALAAAGYYASLGIWRLLAYLAGRNVRRLRVRLSRRGRECEAQALVDTGNRLRDPVTGKPVSIISPEVAAALGIDLAGKGAAGEEEEAGKGFWYIPYHSIGKPEGVMPAVALDAAQVLETPGLYIERPVVAVCEEYLTADEYEMLVNPDLLY